jgi:hypothetical protein
VDDHESQAQEEISIDGSIPRTSAGQRPYWPPVEMSFVTLYSSE